MVFLFCYTEIMKPHVYIFRGAPASGKGTIAAEFAKLLPKPVALIEQDKLRWGIHLIGRSVQDVKSEEHRMAFENTLFLYERYLKSGKYSIVVEGLFTWNNEGSDQGSAVKFLELAKENGFEATSIVLRADKATLHNRNLQRKSYTTPEDEFNMLYDGVYATIDDSELVVDSTNDSSEETINKLRQLI
jgi:predicted kinase